MLEEVIGAPRGDALSEDALGVSSKGEGRFRVFLGQRYSCGVMLGIEVDPGVVGLSFFLLLFFSHVTYASFFLALA